MTNPSRAILGLFAVVMVIYGVVLLVQPLILADLVGLAFLNANAPVEVRAFYGGLELGIAAFLFACARAPELHSAGLLFSTLAFGAAGAARLLGVIQFGFVGPSQPIVAVIELAGAGACFWLLRRASPTG